MEPDEGASTLQVKQPVIDKVTGCLTWFEWELGFSKDVNDSMVGLPLRTIWLAFVLAIMIIYHRVILRTTGRLNALPHMWIE